MKDGIEIPQLGICDIILLFPLDNFLLTSRHGHGHIFRNERTKGFQGQSMRNHIDMGFAQDMSST
jgi:hypothetical protein